MLEVQVHPVGTGDDKQLVKTLKTLARTHQVKIDLRVAQWTPACGIFSESELEGDCVRTTVTDGFATVDEPDRLSRNKFHRTQRVRLQFHRSLFKTGVMTSDGALLLVCRPRSGMIGRLRCQDRCLGLGGQCADERRGCVREAEDGSTAEHGGGISTFPSCLCHCLTLL